MNRKLVGGILGVAVAAVAIWFLVLRGGDEKAATKPADGSGRSAAITPVATPAKPEAEAPRGMAPRWSLDVDPEGPLRLEGQVIGPDGKGVGGATVWIGSVPPRTATAEDDGTFAFDKLVGRTYPLGARSGALIGGPVSYKLTDTSDPVVIRIAEGASVVVTVVDEAKQPVVGAEVRSGGETAGTSAKTDAKGEAALQPVRPGYVMISAVAPGYAPGGGFTTVGSAGATGRITVTLRKGFAVSGRVIDEAGKPISKARVSLDRNRWGMDSDDEDLATTDAKGAFTIPAIAAGTHTLRALDGEHAPARSTPITVSDRPVTGIEITMKAGGIMAGTVLDTAGKPVAYATVRVAGTGQQMWQVSARQATSDAKGAFELRGLIRTKLQARAESEVAASQLVDVDLTEATEKRDVKLVLDVEGKITGIVVDETGAPVAEVQVNAFPDILGGASTEGLALAGMSSATTNGVGEFTITGLPDAAYRLWAARSNSGAQEWGQQGTSAKTGDTGVRITLPAPGGLKGKVALQGASAAPKLVTVQIGYQPPTPATDGVFELKDLTPGSYDVTIRGPEFAQLTKRDIKIEPGKTTDMGTVEVVRGRKLSGKVVDTKGRPVAGAKIKLGEMLFSSEQDKEQWEGFEDMAGIRSAVSDQDGAFSIIGVPAKATLVGADHADAGRSLAVPVAEGTDDPPAVTLALRGFGSIVGKVVQKGQPLGGVAISQSIKGGGAQLSFTQTDDTGAFTMAKVPEGTIVLQAMQQKMMAMKSTSVSVQVTAGKQTKVTIDVPVGTITLTVEIKALPNHKVDAAQVFLMSGSVVASSGKQLMDSFLGGGAQGMKFWLGTGQPLPEFDEIVAGDYSICTVPITGDMKDQTFMQRLNEQASSMKVYCKQVKVPAAPLKQTAVHEVPAMTPLP